MVLYLYFKRNELKNSTPWRAVARLTGYPTISASFERKQEAVDCKRETIRKIKLGQFKFDQHKTASDFYGTVNKLATSLLYFKNIMEIF